MYERVSAMARIGVWECDLATDELSWTDAVYDLFDMPRGSKVERDAALSCYEPASRRELERLRAAAIRDGTGFKLDFNIRTATGNEKWIRLTAEIEQEHGKSVRIFGTKQDISDEKLAQDKVSALQTELIHLSRLSAMNSMASTLAHEMNQPLTAAASYASAANRLAIRANAPPELSECLDQTRAALLRAGGIIKRVREMTRKGFVATQQLDVIQVVNESVFMVTAGNPGVAVTCDLDPNAQILGDRIQFQQVLVNLLQNSIDAAGGSPCRIMVSAIQEDDCVSVWVDDDGPGIPTEILSSIFETHTTTKPGGLGIGLSICRTIVENHRGHIAASNLPQGGASVCFTLPSSHRDRHGPVTGPAVVHLSASHEDAATL